MALDCSLQATMCVVVHWFAVSLAKLVYRRVDHIYTKLHRRERIWSIKQLPLAPARSQDAHIWNGTLILSLMVMRA